MPEEHRNESQTFDSLLDSRSSCSICSVLSRFLSARPCHRSSDIKIINKVTIASIAIFALVIFSTIHVAVFLSDKTLELARIQSEKALINTLLSMNLKELSNVSIY